MEMEMETKTIESKIIPTVLTDIERQLVELSFLVNSDLEKTFSPVLESYPEDSIRQSEDSMSEKIADRLDKVRQKIAFIINDVNFIISRSHV